MSHLLYQSSVDEHLGCFRILAIINRAVMNIVVRVSSNYSFLQVYAKEWDCGSYGNSLLRDRNLVFLTTIFIIPISSKCLIRLYISYICAW